MQTLKMTDVKLSDEHIRALVYGPAGAGKTTLLGSFPKPMLIFDWDQKYKPLVGIPGIEIVSYTVAGTGEATKVFTQFRRDWKEVVRDPQWKTIALDSLTSFDTVNLRHFVCLNGKGDDAVPTLPTYGEQSAYYTFFFTELKNIRDKHVLVTAHEFYNVDAESGIHSIQPLITGKSILAKLPSLFEEVWYMQKKGGSTDDSVLYYRPVKKAIATSLILSGSGSIDNPTFEKIQATKKRS